MTLENDNNTILMFTTRSLCYSSGAFFTSRLSDTFEKMGFHTEICELDNNLAQENEAIITENDCNKLESYIGKSYYAVIDFNSKLPRMIIEDGSYYLDNINAPFFNYILDNPLYHHSTLACKLKNYNVVMVDKNHCEYVKKYYPHIKNVFFSVLSADTSFVNTSYDSKKNEIIFPGTYREPNFYLNMIMNGEYLCENEYLRYDTEARQHIVNIMKAMLDCMSSDTNITMQQALEHIFKKNGFYSLMCSENGVEGSSSLELDYINIFRETMNYAYPVEMYLRNYYRKQLIDNFVKDNTPVTVLGDWWDRYDNIDNRNITWQKPVTFAMSYSLISNYSIILDCSPFFKNGIHDRVFSGMANKTAVITDYNNYKASQGISNTIKMYDINNWKDCVYTAQELLINSSERLNLVENAFDLYKKDYTWQNTAQRFIMR